MKFEDFENLPKLEEVESTEFTCFGAEWSVALCPGGNVPDEDEDSDEEDNASNMLTFI